MFDGSGSGKINCQTTASLRMAAGRDFKAIIENTVTLCHGQARGSKFARQRCAVAGEARDHDQSGGCGQSKISELTWKGRSRT